MGTRDVAGRGTGGTSSTMHSAPAPCSIPEGYYIDANAHLQAGVGALGVEPLLALVAGHVVPGRLAGVVRLLAHGAVHLRLRLLGSFLPLAGGGFLLVSLLLSRVLFLLLLCFLLVCLLSSALVLCIRARPLRRASDTVYSPDCLV